jgi:lipopolysaccharide transport system permease protein
MKARWRERAVGLALLQREDIVPHLIEMNLIVIEADKGERVYWSDLWRYRELFFFLSWRDILVRYKQTVIGIFWAIIRPLLQMIILTFIFGKLAGMHSGGLPYPVMVFAGMLPWQFFASSMAEASNSLIANANMLSKIYFPRIIVPASAVIVSFVDFLISSVLLGGIMVLYAVVPNWQVLLLPFFAGLGLLASLGIGLWLAALNVKYRDFRYVVPFIVQLGVYVTPVPYTSEVVRQKFGQTAYDIYCLNPMVGVINGFRWCIGGHAHVPFDGISVIMSVAMVGAILLSGLWYFRSTEENFADII